MCLIALSNLLFARRLRQRHKPWRTAQVRERPLRVSVLIPARNEAGNLAALLPKLRAHEVFVLDDESTDDTAQFATHAGAPVPNGWTGKNWACQQLADAATGDVLIFCDADVRAAPTAIAATVATMEATGADVLTAFPRHRYFGVWDAAILPVVYQLPIAALLPLPLVSRLRTPIISAGNGQWLAFRREAYQRIGGHGALRGNVLEDVLLARRAKQLGLRLVPVLGSAELSVHMYNSRAELIEGVQKNIGRIPGLIVLLPVLLLSLLNPWAYLLRVLAALRFQQPIHTILLHPLGVLGACALLIAAAAQPQHRWKGRTLPT